MTPKMIPVLNTWISDHMYKALKQNNGIKTAVNVLHSFKNIHMKSACGEMLMYR